MSGAEVTADRLGWIGAHAFHLGGLLQFVVALALAAFVSMFAGRLRSGGLARL